MSEHWKPVVGYDGYYEVSDLGRVRSERRCGTDGGVKSLLETHRGHLRVDLCKDGKQKCKKVHRLVLEAFVKPCPDGMECRHLNGDPQDNRVENLAWGTYAENRADMIAHGRSTRGQKNPNAKLELIDVKFIKHWLNAGYSRKLIASVFDVTESNIGSIATGNTWSYA